MIANSFQLTAYGLGRMAGQEQSEPLAVSRRPMAEPDLPKAKTPHEQNSVQRQIAATDRQIDQFVSGLYGLTEEGARIAEGAA